VAFVHTYCENRPIIVLLAAGEFAIAIAWVRIRRNLWLRIPFVILSSSAFGWLVFLVAQFNHDCAHMFDQLK
jgi:hypothetical protein